MANSSNTRNFDDAEHQQAAEARVKRTENEVELVLQEIEAERDRLRAVRKRVKVNAAIVAAMPLILNYVDFGGHYVVTAIVLGWLLFHVASAYADQTFWQALRDRAPEWQEQRDIARLQLKHAKAHYYEAIRPATKGV